MGVTPAELSCHSIEVELVHQDTVLAGVLLLPSGKGPHPVVLLHGSGPVGRQRDLPVATPERVVAHQAVQQRRGLAGGVVPGVPGWRGGRRGLGGGGVEQVERGNGVQVQRPPGDDQVGHLGRGHDPPSRSRLQSQ